MSTIDAAAGAAQPVSTHVELDRARQASATSTDPNSSDRTKEITASSTKRDTAIQSRLERADKARAAEASARARTDRYESLTSRKTDSEVTQTPDSFKPTADRTAIEVARNSERESLRLGMTAETDTRTSTRTSLNATVERQAQRDALDAISKARSMTDTAGPSASTAGEVASNPSVQTADKTGVGAKTTTTSVDSGATTATRTETPEVDVPSASQTAARSRTSQRTSAGTPNRVSQGSGPGHTELSKNASSTGPGFVADKNNSLRPELDDKAVPGSLGQEAEVADAGEAGEAGETDAADNFERNGNHSDTDSSSKSSTGNSGNQSNQGNSSDQRNGSNQGNSGDQGKQSNQDNQGNSGDRGDRGNQNDQGHSPDQGTTPAPSASKSVADIRNHPGSAELKVNTKDLAASDSTRSQPRKSDAEALRIDPSHAVETTRVVAEAFERTEVFMEQFSERSSEGLDKRPA